MIEYKNRYGDVHTFTKQEDGNVLWEGNFEYCRFGMPNDYSIAYESYCRDMSAFDEHLMHIEDFKEAVHEYDHKKLTYTTLAKTYGSMVKPIPNQISMVDPSGGPYINEHSKLNIFGKELDGLCVQSFKSVKTGYLIQTYGEFDHLADGRTIGGIINTTE